MRDELGFAEFAAERAGALRRQALLLSGEPERAARIADRALAETARHWHRYAARGGAATAEEHVRRVLATTAARRTGAVSVPAGDSGDTDLVWRALASLPPRRRVVLVLHADEGLEDVAIGARLGLPASTVAAERAAGMAALRGVLLRRGRPEDLLPAALADPSRDLPPADLPPPAVPGRRRTRRRVLLATGAAAAVVAAAFAVPALTGRGEVEGPEPAAAPAGGLDWPARGPLSGDRDLLRSALRAWRDGVPAAQQPVAASVLYAGSPDGSRVVLLQGADGTGLIWAAEVVEGAGTLALGRTEPLGRAAPLLALPTGGTAGAVRLLVPPDSTGVLVRDPDLAPGAPLHRLGVDADGLSEPLDPGAAGIPVVVVRGGAEPAVAGSGLVAPGRLSAATGTVEIGPGSLPLPGSADVRAVWFADGALVAAKLGGPVVVASAGPVLATTLPARAGHRRLEARTYEASRGGDLFLATVLRLDGAPACLDTSRLEPPALSVVARRCLPAGLRDGVLYVVAGPPVTEVRVRLPGPAGRPARTVSLRRPAGQPAGTGFVALARVAGLPARGGRGEAYAAGGGVAARFVLGPSSRPRG